MPHVGDVRGLGMMAAVELVADKATKQPFDAAEKVGPRLGKELLNRGLYTRVRGDTLCLAPPLVTTSEQIDRIVGTIRDALQAVLNG
jgi:adenosylmethionine-8-amino-7-oxononanoate aminotransferase